MASAMTRDYTGKDADTKERGAARGGADMDPAYDLLDTAGSDPKNLIVVGNRVLGAEAGEALGSVPREVVKNAVCNVMVVQTGAEGDQRSEGIVHTPGRGG